MKLGVICDGISRDLAHALNVMDEFGLDYAELQFVWDREVGDHDAGEIAQIKELLTLIISSLLPVQAYFCWPHHRVSCG